MFKRRRSVAASGGSGLPFCAMCGQATRMDASTGRCALGHRVAVTAAAVAAPVVGVEAGVTPLVAAAEANEVGTYGEGSRFADEYADTIVWEPSTPAEGSEPVSDHDALDEFIAWEQPGGGSFSALDVDTAEFPVAAAPAAPVASVHEVGGSIIDEPIDTGDSLLDELDDAAHARRQAVGTIGATIAASAVVFVAIAALPF